MLKTYKTLALLALPLLFSAGACTTTAKEDTANSTPAAGLTKDSLVKRGDYLVATMGCDDCHSPKNLGPQGPELDLPHRLSGYPEKRPLAAFTNQALKEGWVLLTGDLTAAAGPWGVSFAANLTSDSTGIGSWTEEQFFTAMRQGKSKGLASNRNLLPPMPWQNFSKMTDTDLRAIFAYLKSTNPVRNIVPPAQAPKSI